MQGYIFETELSEHQKLKVKSTCFTPGEVVRPLPGTTLANTQDQSFTIRNVIVSDDMMIHYEFHECEGRHPHNGFDPVEPGFEVTGVLAEFRGDFYVIGLADAYDVGVSHEDCIRTGAVYQVARNFADRALGKLVFDVPQDAEGVHGLSCFGDFKISTNDEGENYLADIFETETVSPALDFAAMEAISKKLMLGLPSTDPEGRLVTGIHGVLAVSEGELRMVQVDEFSGSTFENGPILTIVRDFDDIADKPANYLSREQLLAASLFDPDDRKIGRFDMVVRADGGYDIIRCQWGPSASLELLEEVDLAADAEPAHPFRIN